MNNDSWPESTSFWHNRRVMVTGGNGFLGKHLVRKLHERGAAEIIIPRSKDYDLAGLNGDCEFGIADCGLRIAD